MEMLEPFVRLEVTAPQSYVGDLTADLSGRRGRIENSDSDGETCTITAMAPLSELMHYATELKSMTAGQGSYSMDFSHEERAPAGVQASVVAAFKPHADED